MDTFGRNALFSSLLITQPARGWCPLLQGRDTVSKSRRPDISGFRVATGYSLTAYPNARFGSHLWVMGSRATQRTPAALLHRRPATQSQSHSNFRL